MTLVVDTSVWVSVFWTRDEHHTLSRDWVERQTAASEVILLPNLFRAELAGSIRRRTGSHPLALRAVNQALALPGVRSVPLTEELGELAGEVAAALSLRGADAVYTALALQERATLITWDQEQRERSQSRVATGTPN